MRRRSSSSGIDPVGDYAALLNLVVRRIGIDLPFEFQAHLRQHVDLGGEPVEIPVVRRFEDRFEQFDRSERIFQLHQFARRHARGGRYAKRCVPSRRSARPARRRLPPDRCPPRSAVPTSSRRLMRPMSRIGMAIQRLSRRPPIGVSVRSITFAKLLLSAPNRWW